MAVTLFRKNKLEVKDRNMGLRSTPMVWAKRQEKESNILKSVDSSISEKK